jgi:hypothetical protein
MTIRQRIHRGNSVFGLESPQDLKRVVLFFCLILISCTKKPVVGPATPEEMVKAFVQMSSEVQTAKDRDRLRGLCQGRLKKAFDSISEDVFMVSYVNQPLKVKDLKIIESIEDGNLARVHYQVQVENPNGQDHTEETSEREVELLRVDGQWYLEAIRPKGSDQIAFTRGMIF